MIEPDSCATLNASPKSARHGDVMPDEKLYRFDVAFGFDGLHNKPVHMRDIWEPHIQAILPNGERWPVSYEDSLDISRPMRIMREWDEAQRPVPKVRAWFKRVFG